MKKKRQEESMKRIFFAEDDLSLIGGLTFALKKQGYETEVARTSLEARRIWKDGRYDLVILDVSLPDGSGYDLCRFIRETSKVPIIFLTAADEETDIIMGLDIGGDDYITKPFKLAVFLSRVNALLRRSGNFGGESADADAEAEAADSAASFSVKCSFRKAAPVPSAQARTRRSRRPAGRHIFFRSDRFIDTFPYRLS